MIKREPFFGGVSYVNEETGEVSTALYPTSETEASAEASDLLTVLVDELGIWGEASPL